MVGAQQFVVGVEAGVSLGEDALTLGPLAKGEKAASQPAMVLSGAALRCV